MMLGWAWSRSMIDIHSWVRSWIRAVEKLEIHVSILKLYFRPKIEVKEEKELGEKQEQEAVKQEDEKKSEKKEERGEKQEKKSKKKKRRA